MVLAPLLLPVIWSGVALSAITQHLCSILYDSWSSQPHLCGSSLSWDLGSRALACSRSPASPSCLCWLVSLLELGWGHRHCTEPQGSLPCVQAS